MIFTGFLKCLAFKESCSYQGGGGAPRPTLAPSTHPTVVEFSQDHTSGMLQEENTPKKINLS